MKEKLYRNSNFFSKFFVHKCKLSIVWNCLNLTKIFVLRLLKMASNQTECSKL